MKCDVIAKGVIEATKQVELDVPVIVRLTGTNAERAATLIDDFTKTNTDVDLHMVQDFDVAAEKAVQLAQ